MEGTRIDIEYAPNSGILHYVRKTGLIYGGIVQRKSDGFTCMAVRSPGATRNHNIEVGDIYAITVNGRRHVLETDWNRWRIRAQEITMLLEGRQPDEWAREYFDPASPKYFKAAPDYDPQPNPELEAKFGAPGRTLTPLQREVRQAERAARAKLKAERPMTMIYGAIALCVILLFLAL